MKKIDCVVHYPAPQDNPYVSLLTRCLKKVGVKAKSKARMDASNPFKALWWARKYTIVHWHWMAAHYQGSTRLKFIIRLILFNICLVMIRLSGTRMILTIHNLYPHEHRFPILHRLSSLTLSWIVNVRIVHSQNAKIAAKKVYGKYPAMYVVPHIDYRFALKDDKSIDINEEIASLGFKLKVERKVILFFGKIRKYKGIEKIIEIANVLDTKGIDIWIVGSITDTVYKKELEQKLDETKNVQSIFKFVEQQELSVLLSKVDAVILPYTSGLTSGAAHLALAYYKQIVAPKNTAFMELIELGIIAGYESDVEDDLLNTIIKAINHPSDTLYQKINLYLDKCSPLRVGQTLKEIYMSTKPKI